MGGICLEGGVVVQTFTSPPEGFDPLTADDSTLELYGLPPRPRGNAEHIKAWEALLGGPSTYIEPAFTTRKGRSHPRKPNAVLGGSSISPNWSGAVVETGRSNDLHPHPPVGSGFTMQVIGQWTVPNIRLPAGPVAYDSSFWVGVDGDNLHDLFQAGVACDVTWLVFNGNAGHIYQDVYAWWQWLPNTPVAHAITNFGVGEGAIISCILTVLSDTVGMVYFKILNGGETVTFRVTVPSGQGVLGKCVDWIAERPTVNNAYSNLANYGEITFSNCSAILTPGNNAHKRFVPSDGITVNMVNGAETLSKATILPNNDVKCDYVGPNY